MHRVATMTDEYSSDQPEEPSVPLGPQAEVPEGGHAETPEYGPAPRPPFGPRVPIPTAPVKLPFHRRTGVLLGAAAVAVAVVAGGVGLALNGSSSHTAAVTPAAESGQGTHHGHHHHGHAVVGTIASENGNTWTVDQVDGTTATVTITPQTRFGTRADQETQSQFVVGNQVAIRGRDTDGVLTARWVGQPRDLQQHHHHGAAAITPSGAQSPDTTPPITPARPN
jgi:hypothetical protein